MPCAVPIATAHISEPFETLEELREAAEVLRRDLLGIAEQGRIARAAVSLQEHRREAGDPQRGLPSGISSPMSGRAGPTAAFGQPGLWHAPGLTPLMPMS